MAYWYVCVYIGFTMTTKPLSGRGLTILYHCACLLLVGSNILATFYIEVRHFLLLPIFAVMYMYMYMYTRTS